MQEHYLRLQKTVNVNGVGLANHHADDDVLDDRLLGKMDNVQDKENLYALGKELAKEYKTKLDNFVKENF